MQGGAPPVNGSDQAVCSRVEVCIMMVSERAHVYAYVDLAPTPALITKLHHTYAA